MNKKTFFCLILILCMVVPASVSFADSVGTLSMNWSGYEASAGNYTSISGSWTVPSVSGAAPTGDAAWIGIGGVASTDLIQTGTLETLDSSNQGQVQYSAWYELLPAGTVTIPLTIRPGDSIFASLSEQSPAIWLISMRDNTTGQSYQTTVNYVSSHSSAEWIEEMPTVSNANGSIQSFLPIDNFNSIKFTGATTIQNGMPETLASSGAQQIAMGNREGFALAVPSTIGNDGESFSVQRTTAAVDSQNGSVRSISPRSFNPGGRRFRTGISVGQLLNPDGYTIQQFLGDSTSSKNITLPFGNGTVTIYFK